jgi:hypothetical protein
MDQSLSTTRKTYKDKRPVPIVTAYEHKEVKKIFGQRYWRSVEQNIHLKNAKGFVKYDDNQECESTIMQYYESKSNVAGLSPFDLISESSLQEILLEQVEWERKIKAWESNKKYKKNHSLIQ